MGLDQSIFTTSKTIAQAIYEGNTPTGKWSAACFSPRNLEGKNEWTGFDTYAQSRLTQWGMEGESEISIPGLEGLGFTLTLQEETVSEERRSKTLDVIRFLGTQGTEGDIPLYQVGLFRKFNALNVILEAIHGQELESDEIVPIDANILRMIRNSCQDALSENANEEVDEWTVSKCEEFVDFVDAILAFPDAEDAWFFYNPWW